MTTGPVDPIDRAWADYIRAVGAATGGADPLLVMAGVAQALGRVTGWTVPADSPLGRIDVTASGASRQAAAIDPPESWADAWLLGGVHEALLAPPERRATGAHYTSRRLASGLVAWATAGGSTLPVQPRICDPAAGGGAFLLAVAELLADLGSDPAETVQHALWGIELNPVAVAVTDAALSHWAWGRGGGTVTAGSHLLHGDALLDRRTDWSDQLVAGGGAPGFDLVVGNPPFKSQLGRTTSRSAQEADALRAAFGDAATGYADSATLFLVAACRMARPGGRVALLQPMSVFAARDAARARAEVLAGARLDGVWLAEQRVFDANVRVGAVVLEVDGGARADRSGTAGSVVRRAAGPDFAQLPDVDTTRTELRSAPSWSHLVAPPGTPVIAGARVSGRLGDFAVATAGFRDQYYGLVPFVADAPNSSGAPLVTSGLIDPACCRWGDAPSRFAGRSWLRPRVDVASLTTADPRLGAWLDRVLVPKVLVACQTRVLEAVVDEAGALVPSVPVIAVCAAEDRLFDVAAVLLAPCTSAWAVRRAGGTALGTDAIKLSAKQVLDVPLPADADAWRAGAEHLRDAGTGLGDAAAFAAIMNRAYALHPDGDLTAWWLARLPVRA